MAPEAPAFLDEVRTAEVIGALCLATDLGIGLPFEHGLQSTIIAMRLADSLGVDAEITGACSSTSVARSMRKAAPNSLTTACCWLISTL